MLAVLFSEKLKIKLEEKLPVLHDKNYAECKELLPEGASLV